MNRKTFFALSLLCRQVLISWTARSRTAAPLAARREWTSPALPSTCPPSRRRTSRTCSLAWSTESTWFLPPSSAKQPTSMLSEPCWGRKAKTSRSSASWRTTRACAGTVAYLHLLWQASLSISTFWVDRFPCDPEIIILKVLNWKNKIRKYIKKK